MKRIIKVNRKAFVLVVLLLCVVVVANAQVIAIKAGKIVYPETGVVRTNQIILVEGRNIKAVGANVAIPRGAKIIDLSSKVVLPGLFDAHTHLCMNMQHGRDAGNYYLTTLRDSTGLRAIQGVANARSMLEHGFTTVRDIGNAANYADTDLRRAIEQGLVPGPTIINAGRIIAPYGGQFQLQPDKQLPVSPNAELFGDKGMLDSLSLVSLIILVEEQISNATGVIITLADERALSQKNSPFRNVNSLAKYISMLMQESNNG